MERYEFCISPDNRLSLCDTVSELVGTFCEQYLKKNRDVLRYRLTVEECLLGWLTEDSIGHTLVLITEKKRFRNPTVILTFDGAQHNPYETEEKRVGGDAGFNALRILGLAPTYSYDEGINTLRFDINPSTSSELRKFGIILALAVLVGFAGPELLSPSALDTVSENILTPVYDTLLSILSLIAGPTIFVSVAWGIFNIGDAISFSRIGKSVILSFIRNDLLVCLLGLCAIPLFGLGFSVSQSGQGQLSGLLSMILGSVPNNFVDPFSNGNTVQIIVMAVIVGTAILFLGKKVSDLVQFIEQANLLLQYILSIVGKLVPYLVFVVVVDLFWTDTFSTMLSAWKFFAVLIIGTLLICTGVTLAINIRYELAPTKLIKKIYQCVMVATFTACTSAVLEEAIVICTDKLGIKKSLASFGVPLGMVVQNPINCFSYLIMTLFCASAYGVECSVTWYLSALFCCTVLAIATPPIPGGGVIVFTMLFMQLGIPVEAVAIVSALNMLADFLTTGGDVFFLFPGMIRAADRGGMLDRDCLRK